MSEPNPYESPKSEEPLQPAQMVKRGVGLATILALTPVAVVSTFCVSCAVGMTLIDAVRIAGRQPPAWIMVTALVVPPLVALVAMIWWAARAYSRDKVETTTSNPKS